MNFFQGLKRFIIFRLFRSMSDKEKHLMIDKLQERLLIASQCRHMSWPKGTRAWGFCRKCKERMP